MSSSASESEPFRRLPQQARSRQRVNQILDAAAQVFEEVGYDAASTELISKRAETSIGSLYRFFPDKSAILYALAERYAQQMQELAAAKMNASMVRQPLAQVLSDIIDAFDSFYTSQPSCRMVMLQSRVSAEIQTVNQRADREIVKQVEAFFALRQPKMPTEQRQLAALVSVEISGTLQLLSLAQDDKRRQQLVDETKQVLIRYLTPLFPDTV